MIIVNADDFGISDAVNRAIVQSFEDGIVSSASIMPNMPSFDDAVRLAYDYHITDKIGFHFNLTEGTPLTESIKSCPRICSDGKSFSYKRNSVWHWSGKEKAAIKEEFKAQIEKLLATGITPTHLDSHQHVHTEIPVFLTIRSLVKEFGITRIRKSKNLGISWKVRPYKLIINSLFRLSGLKTTKYQTKYETPAIVNGSIEYVCHPTMDSENGSIIDAITRDRLTGRYDDITGYSDLK